METPEILERTHVVCSYGGELPQIARDVLRDLLSATARRTLAQTLKSAAKETRVSGCPETAKEFRALIPLVWQEGA